MLKARKSKGINCINCMGDHRLENITLTTVLFYAPIPASYKLKMNEETSYIFSDDIVNYHEK